jgi:hypothetical protein
MTYPARVRVKNDPSHPPTHTHSQLLITSWVNQLRVGGVYRWGPASSTPIPSIGRFLIGPPVPASSPPPPASLWKSCQTTSPPPPPPLYRIRRDDQQKGGNLPGWLAQAGRFLPHMRYIYRDSGERPAESITLQPSVHCTGSLCTHSSYQDLYIYTY